MKYFSLVGSYEGGVRLGRRWIRAQNLNLIDKTGWERLQGPITAAMARCLTDKTYLDFSKPFAHNTVKLYIGMERKYV